VTIDDRDNSRGPERRGLPEGEGNVGAAGFDGLAEVKATGEGILRFTQ
jgi:hypothetical protein